MNPTLSPAFIAAGGLALCAIFALIRAYNAARWRDSRIAVMCLGVSLPLIAGAVVAFWIGTENSAPSFLGHVGFGPDWRCTIYGKGDPVCFRQVPKADASRPASPD
jgi:hypothetical protein